MSSTPSRGLGTAEPIRQPPRVISSVRRFARKSRAILQRLRRAAKHEIYAYWRRQPVRKATVFYESFAGNGMLCNPEAIFRALLDDEEFAQLDHVWALRSRHENRATIREFARNPRVRFVRTGSIGYYRAMATSGYLINNATFPPEFGKRAGQVYLNTWHGTPLKRMGYDIGDPASRVGNVIRNFLSADFLLAANRFMFDQMYESAHLLRQIYGGQIIEEGYPRIDRQFLDAPEVAAARRRLEDAGLAIGDRRIILYAPTWKGTNFNRPEDDATELIDRVTELTSMIDSDRYVVLLKTHQVVHKFASHLPQVKSYLVPNEIPTNVILGVTDVLVTDYSSIFFDFLATGRPIAFLTPDIADYAGYRGLYIEPGEWPGPVLTSVSELAHELNAIDQIGQSPEMSKRYEASQQRFTSHEDGGATGRVIDIVFRNKTDGYTIRRASRSSRRSLLINAGSMRPNGITASLLNLLDSIDYDQLDVSVVFPNSRRAIILGKQRELNPGVRQFARVGGMNGSKLLHWARRRSWARGDLRNHALDPRQKQLWDDEWTRCFGSSVFDYAIDFSGYGAFWATLMLHAPGAERAIWQHNDLAADAHRQTRGRRRQLKEMSGVFSLYGEYDHLVSVSPSLSEINRAGLEEYAEASKFESALNVVNESRVLANAAVDVRASAAIVRVLAVESETGVDELEVPEWANELAVDNDVVTFVTVGRLSPEKNHARMIGAFAVVHAEHPATRLVIVGSGPLRAELERLIERLGLRDAVWLVGHQSNPHAVMARADCFVLSSDYEGQPMVLLEALIVGLPVVTVAFGSARDALPAGVGLVVPSTVESLAEGMTAYLEGRVPMAPFDAAAYNDSAVRQFYRAIGLRGVR
jgi:CDP-glycerol glycerophosphotransferase (TagB/SpsB family)/glycosyltransferase involved in cell wall biosynthesis